MLEPERDYPLARLTTVRTGGAAERFARAGSRARAARAAARGRAQRGLRVARDRLGLEPARRRRRACRGLVLKLERELARIEPRRRRAALRRRRAAAGGRGARGGARPGRDRVRGQHPGHRRRRRADERQRLRRRARRACSTGSRSSSAAGIARARPGRARLRLPQLGAARRRDRRARALRARAGRAGGDPGRRSPSMRERRHAAQPKGIRTFGSTFKNPPGRDRRASSSRPRARPSSRSAARASRASTRTSSRTPGGASTAEIVALMALGRERVRERFGIELEPEVELLGDVRFPGRGSRSSAKQQRMPPREAARSCRACGGCRCACKLGARALLRAVLAARRLRLADRSATARSSGRQRDDRRALAGRRAAPSAQQLARAPRARRRRPTSRPARVRAAVAAVQPRSPACARAPTSPTG